MNEIFEKLRELNGSLENWLFTVTEGPHIGEKLLTEEDKMILAQGDFFKENSIESGSLKKSGIYEIAGTRVFAERLGARNKMVICGGGHVSMAIIAIAKMTGFYVTVVEDRVTFADNAKWAGADEVICDSYKNALSGIEGNENTWFVIVTRGHRFDEECLASILKKPAAYVGMMGSRSRVAAVRSHMLEQGADPEKVRQLHAPIGLAIGAETPEEIAVSVMGEIIQIKNERAKGKGEGFSEELLAALGEDCTKVLATIIQRKGSAPREIGTKMLVYRDGRVLGTVGGGCAEAAVIQAARMMMSRSNGDALVPKVFQAELLPGKQEEDGMVCGGIQEVFLEPC